MNVNRLFHFISLCLALVSSIFCTSNGICQQRTIVVSFNPETYEEKYQIIYDTITPLQREILHNAYIQMDFHGVVSDSIITKLITISDDSLTIDSVKVEIAHFFGRYLCDKCITYLIEHIEDRFSYGDGNSEIDGSNYTAPWSILGNIVMNKGKRWHLLPFILDVLKRKPASENYILFLTPILTLDSNKQPLKLLLNLN